MSGPFIPDNTGYAVGAYICLNAVNLLFLHPKEITHERDEIFHYNTPLAV